jgi:nucleotide-binding universal stress UspA family protein
VPFLHRENDVTQIADRTRVLLASDMSARCDRALDRAAQLARAWQAELVVIHALDPSGVERNQRLSMSLPSWRVPEQWQARVARRLREDIREEGLAADVRVVEGAPATAVLDAALRERAALIVAGIARDEPLGRLRLGSTVERLVREATVPVLTVRRRVRAPYRHVVVATDFSPASHMAVQSAVRWFDEARLTLFHAYYAPADGVDGQPVRNDSWREAADRQCDQFLLDSGIGPDTARRLSRLIERGRPETLLADCVDLEQVDLVIMGTHGHGGLLRSLLGSTAENLLCSLDCDTMVVRSTQPRR